MPKLIAKIPKIIMNHKLFKKNFSSECSSGRVECSFDNTATADKKAFAKSPKIGEQL